MRRECAGALAIGMLAFACRAAEPEDRAEPPAWHDETGPAGLKKGLGGHTGDLDFCNNPASLCMDREGDCDSDVECVAGDRCVANVGARFGMLAAVDVCLPNHCVDAVHDGDEDV